MLAELIICKAIAINQRKRAKKCLQLMKDEGQTIAMQQNESRLAADYLQVLIKIASHTLNRYRMMAWLHYLEAARRRKATQRK